MTIKRKKKNKKRKEKKRKKKERKKEKHPRVKFFFALEGICRQKKNPFQN
jgi:hypothetical protein